MARRKAPARRFGLFLALLGLLLLLSAGQADAHGYIIRSIPADRAVLDRPPTRIQVWLNEGLEARFSSVSLVNERGETIPLVDSGVVSSNSSQLSARIPVTLPNGAYIVNLRVAFASDGHVVYDQLVFWVGQPAGEVETEGEARSANVLEILWRAITLPAFNVLFGAFLLYQLVLLPGWGSSQYAAGGLAPRLMARLNLLIWGALIVATLGTLLALLQQSMALFNTDPGAVLRDGLWSVVLNGTQVGDTLKFRFSFIALIAAIQGTALYVTQRFPRLVTPLWAINILISGLLPGTLSASSHAAASELWMLPSVTVHWVHVLAESAWIGGLVTLVAVLPAALGTLPEAERRPALLAALRRFSVIGVVAVVLLIVTGIYNTALEIAQPGDLSTTAYGLTLVAKIALILPLLLIGLYHHLGTSQDRLARLLTPLASRFRLPERAAFVPSLRLESLVGLGVLIAAAVLASTPPPEPPDADAGLEPPAQALDVGGLNIDLTIDPDASGANTYEVKLSQGEQALDGAKVWARFVYPALDKRSAPLALDDAGGGFYLNAGSELDRAGEWAILIDVLPPDTPIDQAIRAAFRWPLPETSPTLEVRQPSLLNGLGLALVLGAFGLWLGPFTTRRVRALHLEPALVLIGLALLVVTVGVLIGGALLLNNANSQVDALRYPPPGVVNPVLADAQSLAAGKTVYEAKCAVCHGPTGNGDGPQIKSSTALPILSYVLPARRDEAIYRVITRGLATMLPVEMDEKSRWDVINYVRSPVFYAQALPTNR
jgi:copper transport protein